MKRLYEFDLLRIVATFAVITIHAFQPLILTDNVGTIKWWIDNGFYASARWAVPIFLMISGGLILRPRSEIEFGKYYRHRMPRIIYALIAWVGIYALAGIATHSSNAHWDIWFASILKGSPSPGHLYFLFLIIGLYVVAPVLSLLLGKLSGDQLKNMTKAVLLTTCIWGAISFTLNGNLGLNIMTQWIPYVGYFLLGYIAIIEEWYTLASTRLIILGLAFSFVGMLLATHVAMVLENKNLSLYAYEYVSPLVLIMSLSVLLAMQKMWRWNEEKGSLVKIDEKKTRIIAYFSSLTFGVYLCHFLFLLPVAKLIGRLSLADQWYTNLLVIFVTGVICYLANAIFWWATKSARQLLKPARSH